MTDIIKIIPKILYTTTTNMLFIEIPVNAAHALDDINKSKISSKGFISKSLDYQSIKTHTVKYIIRGVINEFSNYYFNLKEYECDKKLWSSNCAIQLTTSIIAGTSAGIVKTTMDPLTPWYINIPGQIAFDICNKFEQCSNGIYTLYSYLAIESLSGIMMNEGISDGFLSGVVAYIGLNNLILTEEQYINPALEFIGNSTLMTNEL